MPLFSTLKILHIKGLRSFASIRLYELTNQFRASGVRQISLDELREFLATMMRTRGLRISSCKVIDKAVAEINDKTDMDLSLAAGEEGEGGFRYQVLHQDQQADGFVSEVRVPLKSETCFLYMLYG